MQKNDIIELNITDLTGSGDGVGHAPDGRVVFVPNTAVGDTVLAHILKVKKKYAFGKIKEIILPAEGRIISDCEISERCGGCVFRHINYKKECEIKQNQVRENFIRIGGIETNITPIVEAENINGYRNKAQIPVGVDRNGNIICGYYTKSSHRIVACNGCKLQPNVFDRIIKIFVSWANDNSLSVYNEQTGRGILRHVYIRRSEQTEEIMVAVVINAEKLPHSDLLVKELLVIPEIKSIQVNINKENTNVVLGKVCKLIYGSEYISDIICGIKVNISPLSFYQVNRNMAEKLYNLAKDFAQPKDKTILDLYCGIGSIGLSMAKTAKQIIGVEIVPEAVQNAKINAQINGIENARFICGDATDAAKELVKENITPNIVILDPPRKGCTEELIKTVANDFAPEIVVYISCNDATLARDCAIFKTLGYKTEYATPVDLFPRTGHIECVVLMSRRND